MNALFFTKKSLGTAIVSIAPVAALLLGLTATTARADWPNTNATKWVQLPNPTITGYDVLAAQPAPAGTASSPPIILADDFQCTTPGPITASPKGAGGPTLGDDTLDFIQLPLDTALAPIIQSINVSGGNVSIDWSSVEGRTYQLLSTTSLNPPAWTDVSNGGVQALGTDTSLTVPVGANAAFYRVALLPQ